MRVYLDHGATTPVDKRVVGAMKPYMLKKFGNASSLHGFGREAREGLENARHGLAQRINAKPEEFIFTSGGSEADNLAVFGAALAAKKAGKGNHVVTSAIEHHAVLESCSALERHGFGVTRVGVDNEGFVGVKDVADAIKKGTVLVSVMLANNEIGTIEDVAGIGKVCREHGVLFHTDAVQGFTKTELDVARQNIDLASFSAHKIFGPKGVGGLYVRGGVEINPMVRGGPQEGGRRAGTENVPGAVGFAKAAELIGKKEVAYTQKLRDCMLKGIEKRIADTKLNGPRSGRRLCNNLNISFKHVEGESMLVYLDMKGIAVSTGSACSSKSLELSHVLNAIGVDKALGNGTLRFTLGHENTKKEIDYVLGALEETVGKLRGMSPFAHGAAGGSGR